MPLEKTVHGAASVKARGIGQRRYWEQVIRDEHADRQHVEYLHHNSVKHDYVQAAKDWPYSSFLRWVKRGITIKEFLLDHAVSTSLMS